MKDSEWMDAFTNGQISASAAELLAAEEEIRKLFPAVELRTVRALVLKIAGELSMDSRQYMNADTIVFHFKAAHEHATQR